MKLASLYSTLNYVYIWKVFFLLKLGSHWQLSDDNLRKDQFLPCIYVMLLLYCNVASVNQFLV